MKEIVNMIRQLQKEYSDNELEVKRLANELHIDPWKIAELCSIMTGIRTTVFILEKVNDKAFDNTVPQCN